VSADSAGSVIHDLGYKGYDGPRLGRRAIVAALAWQSFRAAFGFGRSGKAKIVPFLVLTVMLVPAILKAVVSSLGGKLPVPYDTYVPLLRDVMMLLFAAAQAPELVSRDLRSRVLPLYFSRPLRPADYPVAKLAGFAGACLVQVEVPLLALYLGVIASDHAGGAVWAQTRALAAGLLVGLMWAVVLAAVSLFLAAFTGRRALAAGAIAIYLALTFTLMTTLLVVETPGGNPAGLASAPLSDKVVGLLSPFGLMDGVRRWLGGTSLDYVPDPHGFGIVYAVALIALVAGCVLGLVARYRKAALS
jgi:ABC-2 type transport system permease protein